MADMRRRNEALKKVTKLKKISSKAGKKLAWPPTAVSTGSDAQAET